jgi:hypothetical protein
MARIIEEIAILIGADTRGLNKGMKKSKKDVESLTKGFRRLGRTLIAVFGARALFRGFSRTLRETNTLIKTAKGVGFLTSEYQQLTFALNQVGVGSQKARIALGDFQKRLSKAVAGTNPTFAKAFRAAGLDPKELAKQSPAEAFHTALVQLATLREDPRLAGFAGGVFEEQAGKDITQAIRQWKKFLAAREKFARRVGGLTLAQQDRMELLAEEVGVYNAAWKVFWSKFVADIAPDIIKALNDMEEADVFKKMGERVSKLTNSFIYMKTILDDIRKVFSETFGLPAVEGEETGQQTAEKFKRRAGAGLLTAEAEAGRRRNLFESSGLRPGFDTPAEMKMKRGIRLYLESLPPVNYNIAIDVKNRTDRDLARMVVQEFEKERGKEKRAGSQ